MSGRCTASAVSALCTGPAVPDLLVIAFYSHPRSEGCAALSFPSLRGVTPKREWRHFRARKKRAKVDHVPHDLHCRHRRKTGSHASGVSLPMKGTDAFGCIALFAPENTEHAGAFSAPAVRERCSCMDGPSPMRPVAGLALTAATPWNRCRKAAPHDSA
ncbi:hypothetical protein CBM2633_A70076 [Cupriavidus taiwanensis]|nr:hypothetical protein CBM2633_A70076 [Cupriavidus taiwanensis]